MSEDKRED